MERPALGAIGLGEVGVDPADAFLAEAERLDGAAAVDRLADRPRERGVRGALPQVAGGGVAEVPAGADPDRRQPGEAAGSRRSG